MLIIHTLKPLLILVLIIISIILSKRNNSHFITHHHHHQYHSLKQCTNNQLRSSHTSVLRYAHTVNMREYEPIYTITNTSMQDLLCDWSGKKKKKYRK